MALPPLAKPEDVEAMPGYPAGAADETVEMLIVLASAKVRAFTGCTWTNAAGTALEDVPDGVPELVAGMVVRSLRNPSGATQENAGPFGRSHGSQAVNAVYLSAEDRDFLATISCRLGVYTLSTTRGPLETPPVLDPYAFDDLNPHRW